MIPARGGRRMARARLVTLASVIALTTTGCGAEHGTLVVGSKNFTEQSILGELVAQWIERTTTIPVHRRLHLGGTFICHQALVDGAIDLYVEYTGTAFTAILGHAPVREPARVRRVVSEDYSRLWDVEWADPLGFENTFAILVRGATADSLDLRTISEAARHSASWTPGFGYEFAEREDGFPGLVRAYGLRFATEPKLMDLGLLYRALAERRVDFVAGNSTDGQIAALDLIALEDDRRYFPPYQAVPIVLRRALELHPELGPALAALAGRIDTEEIRALNRAVDVDGRDYRQVVEEWVTAELGESRRRE